MDWQAIMSNPRFIDQYGAYVTGGDPEQFWNNLPEEQKIFLNEQFGPALNQQPTQTEPVLNEQQSNGVGVLEGGFDAYGVPIGTNMETDDPLEGFERVIVGSGTSAASVMYNPQTGEVRAVEGDPTSQLIADGKNIQSMAMESYNKSLAQPVYNAQKDVDALRRIAENQKGDPDGAILSQYTAAQDKLNNAQRAALSQHSNPSAVDLAENRPVPFTTPALTGLEQMEQPFVPNVPNFSPVETGSPTGTGINTQITPNVVNKPNVPNVDFADPTMVPPVQGPNRPVLTDATQPNNETSSGILETTSGPSVRSIMSSSGPKTSNMRGSGMPNLLVDRNEALIRIGGAMYGGALQGNGITAATQEYGNIQDANRKTAMDKYKQDQAQKLAMAKAASKGKGKSDDSTKAMNDLNTQMDSYQRALQAIAESRAAGGNLTGVGGMFKSLLDNFTGDEDGARRLILSKVKVDDALLRVAHTKGAISNAEMKLFLSPAPKNWQDEAIWESWLLERVDALEKVQARLSNGQQVPDDMKGPNVSATRAAINKASNASDGEYKIEQISD